MALDPWFWGGSLAVDAKSAPSAGAVIAGLGQGLPMMNHRSGTIDPTPWESPRQTNLPAGKYEIRAWVRAQQGNVLANNAELRIANMRFAGLRDGDNYFSWVTLDGLSALTINAIQADSGVYCALVQAIPS